MLYQQKHRQKKANLIQKLLEENAKLKLELNECIRDKCSLESEIKILRIILPL